VGEKTFFSFLISSGYDILVVRLEMLNNFSEMKEELSSKLAAANATIEEERAKYARDVEALENRFLVEREKMKRNFDLNFDAAKRELEGTVDKKLSGKVRKTQVMNVLIRKELESQVRQLISYPILSYPVLLQLLQLLYPMLCYAVLCYDSSFCYAMLCYHLLRVLYLIPHLCYPNPVLPYAVCYAILSHTYPILSYRMLGVVVTSYCCAVGRASMRRSCWSSTKTSCSATAT
jgi:hypothetical protein